MYKETSEILGNDPANSIVKADGSYYAGLTKREYFAGLAMQGLLANANGDYIYKEAAEDAIRYANALLEELVKN